MKYAGSKQLVLRRTFPELNRSLILVSLSFYPKEIAKYNDSNKRQRFVNGSVIEFGYCDAEKDVYRYQGAEYNVVRFDELTHFTKEQYTYLISRVRGVNDFPKMMKSSTNPGGVGHAWVKERFIEGFMPNEEHIDDTGRRFRAFDFGYSKPFAVDYDGRAYLYRELYGCTGEPDVGIKWTAQQIAQEICKIEDAEEKGEHILGIADPAIWNKTGSEDVDTKQEDHIYDSIKYFLMANPIPPRKHVKPAEKPFNPLESEPDVMGKYERFIFS